MKVFVAFLLRNTNIYLVIVKTVKKDPKEPKIPGARHLEVLQLFILMILMPYEVFKEAKLLTSLRRKIGKVSFSKFATAVIKS